MKYYVAIRDRRVIDSEWLNEVLSHQKRHSSYGVYDIFGPFNTIETANEQYNNTLRWVDDADYSVFAHDDKSRWWRIITYNDGTSLIRLLDSSLGWKEVKTTFIEAAINAEL